MKKQLTFRFVFLVVFCIGFITPVIQNLNAQEVKKAKVRIKADYFKIMKGNSYLDLKASARIDKQNVEVSNIDLIISNVVGDEFIKLGEVTTNMDGESKFVIKNFDALKSDSTKTYNLLVSFKGNDKFKKTSKKISLKDASIEAKLITKDSINFISATLIDKSKDSVIVKESLSVQVERLFRALPIGEEFNYTDENGTILVPIEEGIPGVNGVLNLEVVLKDHDDFGTVKAIVKAPVGIPIVEESTFNERTLWSPRNKTPIFIILFTSGLILGIWAIVIYLIINLFKISNSKT